MDVYFRCHVRDTKKKGQRVVRFALSFALAPRGFGFGLLCTRWRFEFLQAVGKRWGSVRAKRLLPTSPRLRNSKRKSPSRARPVLLTFFGKTQRVGQARREMKKGIDQKELPCMARKEGKPPSSTPKPKHHEARSQRLKIQRKKPGARPGTGPPR